MVREHDLNYFFFYLNYKSRQTRKHQKLALMMGLNVIHVFNSYLYNKNINSKKLPICMIYVNKMVLFQRNWENN